ncbi:MAG: hypothetical protein U5L09_22685 [Bacteroidales bacterium]|nr:hypothetical protein [Bacteroidales bacterium]
MLKVVNARLCGADEKKIVKAFENYLQEPPEYSRVFWRRGRCPLYIRTMRKQAIKKVFFQ